MPGTYIADQGGFGVSTPDAGESVRDANILFDVAVGPNGELYIVWQDIRFRSTADEAVDEVAFSQSTDGGNSWSPPVRINRTPPNANPLRQQAFIPSVATTADGTLAVTYYDFRFDADDGREATDYWAVFCRPAAGSCADRANWGGEVRLTKSSFDMLNAPVARGHFLGDYMGLTVSGQTIWPVFGIAPGKNIAVLYTRTLDGNVAVSAR